MALGPEFDAILAAAQAGSDRAVAALFKDLQPALLRYLRARESRAYEDVAADVWLGIATGLRGFTGDETSFRSWAFTIAHHRLADHRRRQGRRRDEPVPDTQLDRAEGTGDPADVVASLSAQEALARLVANLPGDQADVVLLRIVADLPVARVAEILGRSEGSVRVLQHRALRRLASTLRAVTTPE